MEPGCAPCQLRVRELLPPRLGFPVCAVKIHPNAQWIFSERKNERRGGIPDAPRPGGRGPFPTQRRGGGVGGQRGLRGWGRRGGQEGEWRRVGRRGGGRVKSCDEGGDREEGGGKGVRGRQGRGGGYTEEREWRRIKQEPSHSTHPPRLHAGWGCSGTERKQDQDPDQNAVDA